jgi:hypothetical protein
VKLLNNKDLKDIYNLCVLNETYYKYCPPSPSIDSIRKDMQALPPKKTLEDKYFLGYYENDRLLAVMDLIDKYPNDKTVFIGFFCAGLKNPCGYVKISSDKNLQKRRNALCRR